MTKHPKLWRSIGLPGIFLSSLGLGTAIPFTLVPDPAMPIMRAVDARPIPQLKTHQGETHIHGQALTLTPAGLRTLGDDQWLDVVAATGLEEAQHTSTARVGFTWFLIDDRGNDVIPDAPEVIRYASPKGEFARTISVPLTMGNGHYRILAFAFGEDSAGTSQWRFSGDLHFRISSHEVRFMNLGTWYAESNAHAPIDKAAEDRNLAIPGRSL